MGEICTRYLSVSSVAAVKEGHCNRNRSEILLNAKLAVGFGSFFPISPNAFTNEIVLIELKSECSVCAVSCPRSFALTRHENVSACSLDMGTELRPTHTHTRKLVDAQHTHNATPKPVDHKAHCGVASTRTRTRHAIWSMMSTAGERADITRPAHAHICVCTTATTMSMSELRPLPFRSKCAVRWQSGWRVLRNNGRVRCWRAAYGTAFCVASIRGIR